MEGTDKSEVQPEKSLCGKISGKISKFFKKVILTFIVLRIILRVMSVFRAYQTQLHLRSAMQQFHKISSGQILLIKSQKNIDILNLFRILFITSK